jgi:AGZA family xanthine/uracil permease-like MFS transporter
LFLAYIGISGNPDAGGAGLIVADQVTKTTFGSFAVPQTLLAALGILLATLFFVKRIKGALLWSIGGISILGWMFSIAAAPQGLMSIPAFPSTLFGQAFAGLSGINGSNIINFISVLLVFLFVDMFDTIGTLMGVGSQAGYIDEKGELPRANQAMSADAIATAVGAVLGTSTVTTFAESASGVAEGGRTGLVAVTAALMVLVALLFVPIFQAVPAFATAPAMIIVGALMMTSIGSIRWGDMTEAIPAYATVLFIPLGYSISTGLSMGIILYPFAKLATGRGREVPLITWILAAVFIARFAFTTLAFSQGS